MCVAQACAHNHPGFSNDEEGPVRWIGAAAVLLGKDPVAEGWLNSDGETLPQPRTMENFVCHLGDHDWVLTVPAAKWTIPLMQEIAMEHYGLSETDVEGKPFNQLRNYVFSQATIMSLYELYVTQGKDALTRTVLSIVAPA
ncbi:MAG: metal-dependent phosphohydrolase, partial [Desulfovibrio sp.]